MKRGKGAPGPGRTTSAGRGNGKRVTMTDVARLAGCSQSTVSVVLNNTPGIRISKTTRARVIAAAGDLGYEIIPGHVALGDRPQQIGIVFDHIATSPEAVVSIEGAREAGWQTGHVVTIAQTLNDPEMEPITIAAMLRNGIDALIYATIMTRKVEVPPALYAARVPVVLLNCYSDDRAFPSVCPGEVAGGHRAADALIGAGHRRIAIITGEMWMDAARDRLRGYRQALATADIPYDPDLVREGNWQTSAGYEHTLALMKLDDPPTAIFCSNDRMAVGCYEALKETGRTIPDDVSVIGYDDEEVARHLTPQLTTLVLPHREMGRWAVEHALSMTSVPTGKHPVTKLECPLIPRDSIREIGG
ncbi:LacI family DNA-binding transcriptional regulator [Bauldia litoralis]|uniref:LacI family DNA-binding transcriptional regulator n=1 Tax=Bauldia litoralis TaxID=665467 RepID=UPI003263C268